MSQGILFDTLYKQDTKAKTRQWVINAHDGSPPFYTVTYGEVGGAQVSTTTKVAAGKNIGKANATTAWEQCQLEAKALWTKQQERKGYSLDASEAKPFSPMLAKSYAEAGNDLTKLKDGKHIKFPCYIQPKLDGIRCIAKRESDGSVSLWSRQGKRFTSMGHIETALATIKNFTAEIYLDGELYVHGDEFQDLVGSIKRDVADEESVKVQYHIYDVVNLAMPGLHFEQRNKFIYEFIKPFAKDCIKVVETGLLIDKDGITYGLHRYINSGYEGAMLRNLKGSYKVGGRSADLQKLKLFIDEEFEIVGAEQNVGRQEAQCTVLCKTKAGTVFGVKPEGDDAVREQYWRDFKAGKLVGKFLTVRFFSWTTSENPVPRFPVGVSVRNYE
jgi:ATP-dependent DNA ligase